jgi:hypothetical protein
MLRSIDAPSQGSESTELNDREAPSQNENKTHGHEEQEFVATTPAVRLFRCFAAGGSEQSWVVSEG